AWDSIGQALGRAGVEIDQEDRNRGIYIVRFTGAAAQEKQGMFSKLKFWGDDAQQLQLSLTGVGDKTEIVALNRDGQWETSAATVQFLTRL
ncbi:MAG: outer membrane protein assembly factor BamC, partial [Gammaproteobacteria bacterium]